jgi:hypothetical protein
MATVDDLLLDQKIQAAQQHIERLLGFKIEETFGGQDQDPVPPVLVEAVCQLAAWWYEQREAAVTGTIVNEVPFSVREIVAEFREYTF